MRIIIALALVLLAAGCSSHRSFIDEPIIDRKGVDMTRYYADKTECEAYADEVRTEEKIARGAIGGAIVGGAIGAIVNRGPDSAGVVRGRAVPAVHAVRKKAFVRQNTS